MQQWTEHRDEFLDALLWLDGRGDSLSALGCPICVSPGVSGTFRCDECFGHDLVCQTCCLQRHQLLPLHRIKVWGRPSLGIAETYPYLCLKKWNGDFFERMSLADLGLVIQLGHNESPCPSPQNAGLGFTVLHTNGFHHINLQFCGCSFAEHPRLQLLRKSWYPATIVAPHTCATFTLLRRFHILSLQSKVSAAHFYASLERETDNGGTLHIKVLSFPRPLIRHTYELRIFMKSRYHAFLRMVRQWRHLKLLKRAGRGHDPSGVSCTQSGELAVLCPACPHPGINIPDNWRELPSSSQ